MAKHHVVRYPLYGVICVPWRDEVGGVTRFLRSD
jgi:hypothetical protein